MSEETTDQKSIGAPVSPEKLTLQEIHGLHMHQLMYEQLVHDKMKQEGEKILPDKIEEADNKDLNVQQCNGNREAHEVVEALVIKGHKGKNSNDSSEAFHQNARNQHPTTLENYGKNAFPENILNTIPPPIEPESLSKPREREGEHEHLQGVRRTVWANMNHFPNWLESEERNNQEGSSKPPPSDPDSSPDHKSTIPNNPTSILEPDEKEIYIVYRALKNSPVPDDLSSSVSDLKVCEISILKIAKGKWINFIELKNITNPCDISEVTPDSSITRQGDAVEVEKMDANSEFNESVPSEQNATEVSSSPQEPTVDDQIDSESEESVSSSVDEERAYLHESKSSELSTKGELSSSCETSKTSACVESGESRFSFKPMEACFTMSSQFVRYLGIALILLMLFQKVSDPARVEAHTFGALIPAPSSAIALYSPQRDLSTHAICPKTTDVYPAFLIQLLINETVRQQRRQKSSESTLKLHSTVKEKSTRAKIRLAEELPVCNAVDSYHPSQAHLETCLVSDTVTSNVTSSHLFGMESLEARNSWQNLSVVLMPVGSKSCHTTMASFITAETHAKYFDQPWKYTVEFVTLPFYSLVKFSLVIVIAIWLNRRDNQYLVGISTSEIPQSDQWSFSPYDSEETTSSTDPYTSAISKEDDDTLQCPSEPHSSETDSESSSGELEISPATNVENITKPHSADFHDKSSLLTSKAVQPTTTTTTTSVSDSPTSGPDKETRMMARHTNPVHSENPERGYRLIESGKDAVSVADSESEFLMKPSESHDTTSDVTQPPSLPSESHDTTSDVTQPPSLPSESHDTISDVTQPPSLPSESHDTTSDVTQPPSLPSESHDTTSDVTQPPSLPSESHDTTSDVTQPPSLPSESHDTTSDVTQPPSLPSESHDTTSGVTQPPSLPSESHDTTSGVMQPPSLDTKSSNMTDMLGLQENQCSLSTHDDVGAETHENIPLQEMEGEQDEGGSETTPCHMLVNSLQSDHINGIKDPVLENARCECLADASEDHNAATGFQQLSDKGESDTTDDTTRTLPLWKNQFLPLIQNDPGGETHEQESESNQYKHDSEEAPFDQLIDSHPLDHCSSIKDPVSEYPSSAHASELPWTDVPLPSDSLAISKVPHESQCLSDVCSLATDTQRLPSPFDKGESDLVECFASVSCGKPTLPEMIPLRNGKSSERVTNTQQPPSLPDKGGSDTTAVIIILERGHHPPSAQFLTPDNTDGTVETPPEEGESKGTQFGQSADPLQSGHNNNIKDSVLQHSSCVPEFSCAGTTLASSEVTEQSLTDQEEGYLTNPDIMEPPSLSGDGVNDTQPILAHQPPILVQDGSELESKTTPITNVPDQTICTDLNQPNTTVSQQSHSEDISSKTTSSSRRGPSQPSAPQPILQNHQSSVTASDPVRAQSPAPKSSPLTPKPPWRNSIPHPVCESSLGNDYIDTVRGPWPRPPGATGSGGGGRGGGGRGGGKEIGDGEESDHDHQETGDQVFVQPAISEAPKPKKTTKKSNPAIGRLKHPTGSEQSQDSGYGTGPIKSPVGDGKPVHLPPANPPGFPDLLIPGEEQTRNQSSMLVCVTIKPTGEPQADDIETTSSAQPEPRPNNSTATLELQRESTPHPSSDMHSLEHSSRFDSENDSGSPSGVCCPKSPSEAQTENPVSSSVSIAETTPTTFPAQVHDDELPPAKVDEKHSSPTYPAILTPRIVPPCNPQQQCNSPQQSTQQEEEREANPLGNTHSPSPPPTSNLFISPKHTPSREPFERQSLKLLGQQLGEKEVHPLCATDNPSPSPNDANLAQVLVSHVPGCDPQLPQHTPETTQQEEGRGNNLSHCMVLVATQTILTISSLLFGSVHQTTTLYSRDHPPPATICLVPKLTSARQLHHGHPLQPPTHQEDGGEPHPHHARPLPEQESLTPSFLNPLGPISLVPGCEHPTAPLPSQNYPLPSITPLSLDSLGKIGSPLSSITTGAVASQPSCVQSFPATTEQPHLSEEIECTLPHPTPTQAGARPHPPSLSVGVDDPPNILSGPMRQFLSPSGEEPQLPQPYLLHKEEPPPPPVSPCPLLQLECTSQSASVSPFPAMVVPRMPQRHTHQVTETTGISDTSQESSE